MTEYDDEILRGRSLASEAAAASKALDREALRIGTAGGQPVPPDTGAAAGDAAYRTAWRREVFASQMFWTWVKQHAHFVTDQDLGILLRVLAGRTPTHPMRTNDDGATGHVVAASAGAGSTC